MALIHHGDVETEPVPERSGLPPGFHCGCKLRHLYPSLVLMEWDAAGQDVATFVLHHVLKGAAVDPAFDAAGLRGTTKIISQLFQTLVLGNFLNVRLIQRLKEVDKSAVFGFNV